MVSQPEPQWPTIDEIPACHERARVRSLIRSSGVGPQGRCNHGIALLLRANVQLAADLAVDGREVWKRLLQKAQSRGHLCFAHLDTAKRMISQAVHQLTGLDLEPGFGIVPEFPGSCGHDSSQGSNIDERC